MNMSLSSWIISYIIDLVFWLWVLLWGGAEFLEDSILGWLFFGYAESHAELIKLVGWIFLIFSTIFFIAGIFSPSFRDLNFLF